MAIVFSQLTYNITPGYAHAASKNDAFFKTKYIYTNPVGAFVSPTEGSFFIYLFLRRLGDFSRAEDGQMVIGAVPVKWLRCTNKTDEAESRDAYRPLRGCLTAGVAAGATFRPGY